MHRLRPAALLSVVSLAGGCYAYAPIEPGAVRPGLAVRARISPAAAQRVAPLLGGGETRLLTGTLIDNRPDTIVIEVPSVTQATGSGAVETLHQRLSLARADLIEVETRRIDRFRTGLVVGGVALLAGTVVIKSLNGDPGSNGPPGPGGPGEVRLPIAGVKF